MTERNITRRGFFGLVARTAAAGLAAVATLDSPVESAETNKVTERKSSAVPADRSDVVAYGNPCANYQQGAVYASCNSDGVCKTGCPFYELEHLGDYQGAGDAGRSNSLKDTKVAYFPGADRQNSANPDPHARSARVAA